MEILRENLLQARSFMRKFELLPSEIEGILAKLEDQIKNVEIEALDVSFQADTPEENLKLLLATPADQVHRLAISSDAKAALNEAKDADLGLGYSLEKYGAMAVTMGATAASYGATFLACQNIDYGEMDDQCTAALQTPLIALSAAGIGAGIASLVYRKRSSEQERKDAILIKKQDEALENALETYYQMGKKASELPADEKQNLRAKLPALKAAIGNAGFKWVNADQVLYCLEQAVKENSA
jgi:hypothetical protein